jgi:hypothetical protein
VTVNDAGRPKLVKEAFAHSKRLGLLKLVIEADTWPIACPVPARIDFENTVINNCSLQLEAVVVNTLTASRTRICIGTFKLSNGQKRLTIANIIGDEHKSLYESNAKTLYIISIDGVAIWDGREERVRFDPDLTLQIQPFAASHEMKLTLMQRLRRIFK